MRDTRSATRAAPASAAGSSRKRGSAGWIPQDPPFRPQGRRGAIAQLGERLNGIQEVGGSIPPGSTKYPLLITVAHPLALCRALAAWMELPGIRARGRAPDPPPFANADSRHSRRPDTNFRPLMVEAGFRLIGDLLDLRWRSQAPRKMRDAVWAKPRCFCLETEHQAISSSAATTSRRGVSGFISRVNQGDGSIPLPSRGIRCESTGRLVDRQRSPDRRECALRA